MGCATVTGRSSARGSGSGKRSRRFPADYKRLAPGRKRSWLAGEECGGLVETGDLQPNQVLAEVRRLEKERLAVMRVAPTPAVVDDYDAGQSFPPKADTGSCRMRKARVVVRPEELPVWWPSYYVRRGTLYEAHTFKTLSQIDGDDERAVMARRVDADSAAVMAELDGFFANPPETTESPSAAALRRLEESGAAVVEAKLLLESEEELAAEIGRFLAAGETRVPMSVNFASQ